MPEIDLVHEYCVKYKDSYVPIAGRKASFYIQDITAGGKPAKSVEELMVIGTVLQGASSVRKSSYSGKLTDAHLEFTHPEPGFINFRDTALYMLRVPSRQWTRTLSGRSTELFSLFRFAPLAMEASLAHHVLSHGETIDPGNFLVALDSVVSLEHQARAIGQHYALAAVPGCARPALFYKKWAIGYVNDDAEICIPRVNAHLREDLIESFGDRVHVTA